MKNILAAKALMALGILLILSGCQGGAEKAAPTEERVSNMDIQKNAGLTTKQLQQIPLEQLYEKYLDLQTKELIDFPTLVKRLKNNQVIYVGETHDNKKHHQFQLQLLKALYQNKSIDTLAMEFLYRSQQEKLNDYAGGETTDGQLRDLVYAGFGDIYPLYEPMIRFAREKQLNLVGLNVEKEIKAKMVDEGWDKLTDAEKKLIARDIDTSNEEHRKYVMQQFGGMVQSGRVPKARLDRLYILQCIWDETFGETIANCLKVNSSGKILVIAGSGHINYKFNIPERANKRYKANYKTIIPIEINNLGDLNPDELINSGIADFIYFSPASS